MFFMENKNIINKTLKKNKLYVQLEQSLFLMQLEVLRLKLNEMW